MRWSIFLIGLFLAAVLQVSLRSTVALGEYAPEFIMMVVVFVAFFAPRIQALWAAWIAGMLLDMLVDLPQGPGIVGPLLGPYALGFTLATYLLVLVRPMLIRRRLSTLCVMTLPFCMVTALVVIFLHATHSWYEDVNLFWGDGRPWVEFTRQSFSALYSAVLMLLVGPVLLWTLPSWGFQSVVARTGWS